MQQFHVEKLNEWFQPIKGWNAKFSTAGHILGAASLLLDVAGRRILFRRSRSARRQFDESARFTPQADTVLIESTYGNRVHPEENINAELGVALKKLLLGVAWRSCQSLQWVVRRRSCTALRNSKAQGQIPHGLPIFLDSPMAVHTTALFKKHMGEHRLSAQEVQAMDHVATMIETPEQSKALVKRHGPMVILSASGMATGGRVLHHLADHVGNHRNMIILTGFQSPGTRGATLASGSPTLRLHGKDLCPWPAEIFS
jgi:metallo-beta-lactamase family protein